MTSTGPLLAYGDPHGEFTPLFRAAQEHRPAAVLIVGDFDPSKPIRQILAPLLEQGIRVRWIPGNHDGDSSEWHERTLLDWPEANLHSRLDELCGLRVAGLGGTFRERIWWPKDDAAAAPAFWSRAEAQKAHGHGKTMPLWNSVTVYPEDWAATADLWADILVCHEAPTSHRYGFAGIDELARRTGARLVIHGHHHLPHEGRIEWQGGGCAVRGLGRAEPWLVEIPS